LGLWEPAKLVARRHGRGPDGRRLQLRGELSAHLAAELGSSHSFTTDRGSVGRRAGSSLQSLAWPWCAWVAGGIPLTDDEAYYRLWALAPALSYLDHPPMAGWMIAAGRWIGGDNPFGSVLRHHWLRCSVPSSCGERQRSSSTGTSP